MVRPVVAGAIAGVLAMLIFHQGALLLLRELALQVPEARILLGIGPMPFRITAVPPFGLPAVLSAVLWGAAWGVVLAFAQRPGAVPPLLTGLVFGALVVTVVGFTLVPWASGMPLLAGGDRQAWSRAVLANGAWGLGTALLLAGLPHRR
jgi:hypothetical protein